MTRLERPTLQLTADAQPFWDGVKGGELVLPRCNSCGEFCHYPSSFCPGCLSRDLAWIKCSGRGKVYSYVIEHRPGMGSRNDAPNIIAVVQLDEGPRLMAGLAGVTPDAVHVDMPVEVTSEGAGDGPPMLKFRRAQDGPGPRG